ncbi:GtrA family protein [Lichenihabitans sp. Uapishka_5]|uniref:GtrA family protein n=1 Tax=Lichenihabitans sp. Uapishka_5 TaxID=3037302 RepID=UPI0029E7F944|nr:GtrA family protein [Lichenihabitans sp. Uapishka_5]MDX7952951.1 GtrA family protein [Lichenihabitans sp. Uapishka_5]
MLRFFLASLFGLGLDISVAWALTTVAGLSLIGSVTVSIGLASVVMYFVHEFWTFAGASRTASASRALGTVASALVALGVRSMSLYLTSTWLGLQDRWILTQIIAATGLSFATNYLLVRRLLDGRAIERSARQDGVAVARKRVSP